VRPPQLASPGPDPDPALTDQVTALISALVAKEESPVMSAAYRAWYRSTVAPWRSWIGGQLSRLGPPRFLATARLGGRSIWGAEPLDRVVYYALSRPGGTAYLTIGVTADGTIGRVDLVPR
jgi:hypothetical protein